ncbi:MAG: ABC transporter ATP-binding protein [Desulfohalobiaceae bacterium]
MPFSLQDIHFNYQNAEILRGINITLSPGRICGILGPNGSGKTTWLDLLIRHKIPSSGKINYQGRPLADWGRKELARELALVPQDFQLNFPFRVLEVLLMGRYPYLSRFSPPGARDMHKVEEVLKQTGLRQLRDRYVTELSGGERQRVVFARALTQDTPVLILDEATSSLDIKHGLHLLSLLQQKNREQGTTILAVFQDINLAAAFCQELIFFKQGRLLLHGPTREVLNEENLQWIFEIPAKVYYDDYAQSAQVVYSIGKEAG